MIIFDLDNILANCEHRRHFIDAEKNPEYIFMKGDMMTRLSDGYYKPREDTSGFIKFKPDWKAFYEACDKDEPIEPVINLYQDLYETYDEYDVEIWSGRCESVREKTQQWLNIHLFPIKLKSSQLKMRPIGDNTPDDQLKEKWLDEYLNNVSFMEPPINEDIGLSISRKHRRIEMVFDDRKKVIEMWRRRGIFVFDVSQGKGDF